VSPSPSSGSLSARYHTGDTWDDGYVGTITLTASGGSVTGWSVTLTLPDGASVTGFWGGQDSVNGSTVTVTASSWDTTIAPGSPATLGFQVSQQGRPKKPLTCTVNGRDCDGL
jgi:cellulase/cellobiase CelA1